MWEYKVIKKMSTNPSLKTSKEQFYNTAKLYICDSSTKESNR